MGERFDCKERVMAEKKYVEREAAKACVKEHYDDAIVIAIDKLPAADVRPVVRGKWKERRFSEDVYGAECSVCHTTWDYGTNFCPNCGARMEES